MTPDLRLLLYDTKNLTDLRLKGDHLEKISRWNLIGRIIRYYHREEKDSAIIAKIREILEANGCSQIKAKNKFYSLKNLTRERVQALFKGKHIPCFNNLRRKEKGSENFNEIDLTSPGEEKVTISIDQMNLIIALKVTAKSKHIKSVIEDCGTQNPIPIPEGNEGINKESIRDAFLFLINPNELPDDPVKWLYMVATLNYLDVPIEEIVTEETSAPIINFCIEQPELCKKLNIPSLVLMRALGYVAQNKLSGKTSWFCSQKTLSFCKVYREYCEKKLLPLNISKNEITILKNYRDCDDQEIKLVVQLANFLSRTILHITLDWAPVVPLVSNPLSLECRYESPKVLSKILTSPNVIKHISLYEKKYTPIFEKLQPRVESVFIDYYNDLYYHGFTAPVFLPKNFPIQWLENNPSLRHCEIAYAYPPIAEAINANPNLETLKTGKYFSLLWMNTVTNLVPVNLRRFEMDLPSDYEAIGSPKSFPNYNLLIERLPLSLENLSMNARTIPLRTVPGIIQKCPHLKTLNCTIPDVYEASNQLLEAISSREDIHYTFHISFDRTSDYYKTWEIYQNSPGSASMREAFFEQYKHTTYYQLNQLRKQNPHLKIQLIFGGSDQVPEIFREFERVP